MGRLKKRSKQLLEARKIAKMKNTVRKDHELDLDKVTPAPSTPTNSSVLLSMQTSSKKKTVDIPAMDIGSSSSLFNDQSAKQAYRTIIDISQIEKLLSPLLCPYCNADGLTLHSDDNSRFGLVLKLKLYCDNCGTVVNDVFTSERSLNDKKFSINTSAVVASSLCGLGPLTFNNFCEHLDLPGLSAKNFYNRTKSIYKDAEDVRQALRSKTIRLVRKEHAKNSNSALSDDDILDIAVSFDGTWMTRGHKSMIGVSCVIDVLTGYVIDFEVLSSFCQTCSTTGTRLKAQSPALYKEWFESHKPDCDINYTGSSGMMETHAAEILWRRSIEKFKLRYTTMLSDGDSKAFNKVCEIKPYGDVPITKEECVNHVGKRMGTALRNLVTDCSKKGISLGGNGVGKLTQQTIKKLSKYYTRAIRKHNDAKQMRNAILASMYHNFSTDKRPMHHLCPSGADSWCFYKSCEAKNVKPGKHSLHIHTPLNYDLLAEHLKPIYKRLSEPQLLQRCLLGSTQNANESFHSCIWNICSKSRFSSLKKVNFSVLAAVGQFNFGFSFGSEIKSFFDCQVSKSSQRLGLLRLKKRLKNAAYKKQQVVKRRLLLRKEAKARKELQFIEAEGVSYSSGHF
ncbi:uncharacterized protein LOC129924445 [Biomphalaria glabrata]|uniref:Uncharacterized protein LOC129924445 n=1 Tax=Biomphalaria glabrata TaxID=6526 RepID=A0A9W2ZIJ0_BIOGL|nr:uncharacterized protein LOC129924445 [Biomphalaria glabrata]